MNFQIYKMISYLFPAIISIIISYSAIKMARRKHREGKWGFFTLLLNPLIFVLWCLPDNSWTGSTSDRAPSLLKCTVCGRSVASDAKKCPNCGARNVGFHQHLPSVIEYLGLTLSALTTLAGIAVMYDPSYFKELGGAEFPACDSAETESLAEETYREIPLNSFVNKNILTWHRIETLRNGVCKANILSSNGNHENIFMTYRNEDGKVIMSLRVAD